MNWKVHGSDPTRSSAKFRWAQNVWAQNVWTNIFIFKFIFIRLAIYSVSGTILESFGHFLFI